MIVPQGQQLTAIPTDDTKRSRAMDNWAKQLVACFLVLLAFCILALCVLQASDIVSTPYQPVELVITSNTTTRAAVRSLNQSSDVAAAEQCRQQLPGAIIAGIQKCGTGALLVFLNLHPQVAAVTNPEHPAGNVAFELKFFTNNYKRGLGWYRRHMPCSFRDQVTIEKDPPYFFEPYAAKRIKKMDPNIKIIFIVKDPIERALSNYAMYIKGRLTSHPTFEEQVTDETGEVNQNSAFLKHSSYARYVKFWLQELKIEQMLFVNGEKFESDPVVELKRIEQFLHIQPYFDSNMFWFNATKGKHCFYSKDKDALCLSEGKGRQHPVISDTLRLKLQDHFKPINEQFFSQIKQRFDWGY